MGVGKGACNSVQLSNGCAKSLFNRIKTEFIEDCTRFSTCQLQMPPRLPLVAKAVSSLSLPSRPFICSSCRYKQARALFNGPAGTRTQSNHKARRTTLQIRTASTTASVTAVNVRRDIPPVFRSLHESLKALETEAPVYINLSQLRLALRGLESDNAVTRIAGKSGPNESID